MYSQVDQVGKAPIPGTHSSIFLNSCIIMANVTTSCITDSANITR